MILVLQVIIILAHVIAVSVQKLHVSVCEYQYTDLSVRIPYYQYTNTIRPIHAFIGFDQSHLFVALSSK